MKRALLIAGGTIGGIGAVLSITPPQLGSTATAPGTSLGTGSTSTGTGLGSGTQTPTPGPQTGTPVATPVATKPSAATPTPSATKKKTTHSTKKATPAATKTQGGTATTPTPTPAQTQTATPTPTPTPTKTQAPPPPPPTAKGVSGTFTGNVYQANQGGRVWGNVQVTVTLVDGAISTVQATQNPQSRGQYAFNWLTPAIKTQKLTVKDVMAIAPSSLLGSNSGASYSAMAYWQSLQSALTKSGA